jgi:LacI family transcriptional regulator
MSVPEDLSVVGFDDSVLARNAEIPLTSINAEQKEMGVTAVDLLYEKTQYREARPKRTIVVQPRIVPRLSTAPPGCEAGSSGAVS